jgi:effector-binding domain-containing protein
VYRTTTTDRFDVLAGFPVDAPAVDGLEIAELPAGEIVSHLHVGPYDTMAASYELLDEWCSHEDFDRPVISWEEYLDGPESSVDPAHWRTRIVYPLPSLTA